MENVENVENVEQLDKLKVGDMVCKIFSSRSNFDRYEFHKIARLTPKMAILENGKKILNEPLVSKHHSSVYFEEYSASRAAYWLATDEIIEQHKENAYARDVEYWFIEKKFSLSEKKLIYEYFKNLKKHENNG